MRPNPMKRRLGDGGVSLGTMVFEFRTPGIARIVAATGAEFAVFDMEHTGWSDETIAMLMATARATDVVPLVRVPGKLYHLLSRPLDVGALGLMVPMVETAEQARELVDHVKYPPVGTRGAAFGMAHDDYVPGDIAHTISAANSEGLLLTQIESVAGLENVDAIAAVEGVDVLWLGQFDLTASMGIPGRFDDQRFLDAVAAVVAAAERHGKAAGMMTTTPEQGRWALDQGFRAVAHWGDLWIYATALQRGLDEIRGHVGERSTDPTGQ
jgi:2-keto-3-deoxy-L-rhamnonate aldolase RhmA